MFPSWLPLFLLLGGSVVHSAALQNELLADVPVLNVLHEDERGIVECTVCRTLVNTVMGWLEDDVPLDEILNRATNWCINLGAGTERVCRGRVTLNAGPILWIFEERNSSGNPISPADACGFMLYRECNLDPSYEWTLDLNFLGPKPTPEVPQLPPEGSPTLKVLQITDVHVDPNYSPGSKAECNEPVCCRADQGPPENGTTGAGYWGDYRQCDCPMHAFADMLSDAAARHQDLAYIIFSGDIIDHGDWDTSVQYNSDNIELVMGEIEAHFPGVPVLPIFGNHEGNPYPLKTEIPSDLQSTWLYEVAARVWGSWLPPSTQPDILAGGMYQVDINPKFKVIALNSMFCYAYNWWLMYDNVDPAGELIWLANQLLMAEAAGQRVHVLAHLHSGSDDCVHTWSAQYRRIIDRFENTVVAQFHGHTHNDHFSVFYDLNDSSRPTNLAFIAGSGTPFANVNPNYRVYSLDGGHPTASFRILDHETWFFNLTEANLAGPAESPRWQLLYRFTEAYQLPSMLPAEMNNLVLRLVNDSDLAQIYHRHYIKAGDPGLGETCDELCQRDHVCEIVTTVVDDDSKCIELYP